MKKIVLLLGLCCIVCCSYAQQVKRERVSDDSEVAQARYVRMKEVAGDAGANAFFLHNDSSIICSLQCRKGMQQNSMHSEYVKDCKGKPFYQSSGNTKEYYHQVCREDSLFSYYIYYGYNKVRIGYEVYAMNESKLVKDTVVQNFAILNGNYKYKQVLHSVSSNQRYLAFDFLFGKTDMNSKNHLTVIDRHEWYRIDTYTNKIEHLKKPFGYSVLSVYNDVKLRIADNGELFELGYLMTDKEELKKLNFQQDIDYSALTDSLAHYYLQITRFPLHTRGNIVNHFEYNRTIGGWDFKLFDEKLLVYGFEYKGQSMDFFTQNFNINTEKFSDIVSAPVAFDFHKSVRIDGFGMLTYWDHFILYPIDLHQRKDGSYVCVADWKSLYHPESFWYRADFIIHLNLLRIEMDEEMQVKTQDVHYNMFASSVTPEYSCYNTQLYTATQGDDLYVFLPIARANRKKKMESFQWMSMHSNMKVVRINASKEYYEEIVTTDLKDDVLYASPYYDKRHQDWIVPVLSEEKVSLERWKIKE